MQILNDFNTTVEKAFDEIDPRWREYDGLIVCGTHTPHDTELMIGRIKDARVSGRPFLGICAGHQLAAIEYARNVLGIKDATSEEFGSGTFVVKKLHKLKVGIIDGESYWNNYEVAIDVNHPENFFTTQAHPEYTSTRDRPHPLLVSFLNYCKCPNGNAGTRQV